MADADHVEGTADKILKVIRTGELKASEVDRPMLQAAGMSIDAFGNIAFGGATVSWSKLLLTRPHWRLKLALVWWQIRTIL